MIVKLFFIGNDWPTLFWEADAVSRLCKGLTEEKKSV